MRIVAMIPARMNSSRFPGKPLAQLLGRPMIEHVLRRTAMCEELDAVYVATCDEEIRKVVEKIGGSVLMTSAAHERASDRVAEAAGRVEADIVVMIQGDEPMITPRMIASAFAPMLGDPSIVCVNLARRIKSRDEYVDPNTVKVVMNVHSDALYFSRTPIPAFTFTHESASDSASNFSSDLQSDLQRARVPIFKQVCVIPFRRDYLREFARLPPTPLERAESIDMLRVIEHGGRVRLVETETDTHAVDTPADLRLVESLLEGDPLVLRYGETRSLRPVAGV